MKDDIVRNLKTKGIDKLEELKKLEEEAIKKLEELLKKDTTYEK